MPLPFLVWSFCGPARTCRFSGTPKMNAKYREGTRWVAKFCPWSFPGAWRSVRVTRLVSLSTYKRPSLSLGAPHLDWRETQQGVVLVTGF